MTEYSASTENATSKLTYKTADEDATVTVKLNGVTVTGSTITWDSDPSDVRSNVLELEVVDGDLSKTYTVSVSKEPPEENPGEDPGEDPEAGPEAGE